MRIAIIGMGVAGVSILRNLAQDARFEAMSVDIYDASRHMGQGIPFQNDSEELLINLPSKFMTLNMHRDSEFWDWYQTQSIFKYQHDTFLPRFVFGHYIKDTLDMILKRHRNVHVIKHKVAEMYALEDASAPFRLTYHVVTEETEAERVYDYVFLTIGTLSYHDPYELKGTPGFIATPYPTYETLQCVDDDARVAIVGTGLASMDVIRYVTAHHQNLPITVTSRRGILPSVRGDMIDIAFEYLTEHHFEALKREHKGIVPLNIALDYFKRDCARYNIDLDTLIHRRTGDVIKDLAYDLAHPETLGHFQSMLEAVKGEMNWIWNSLCREDQSLFLEKYNRILKDHSNPMPPETAQLIIDCIKDGKVLIRSGLEEVTYSDGVYTFKYEHDDTEVFDVVINATGAKTQLSTLDEDDRFVLLLEDRQLIQAHALGGIQIVPETNEVISPRFGTLRNMVAIGQLTNGINQARNGVRMILKQSQRAAEAVYDKSTN